MSICISNRFILRKFYLAHLIVGVMAVCFMQMAKAQSAPSSLLELTIPQIQEAYATGALTAVGLVQFYLNRIERLDRNRPNLNSVRSINPNALSVAAALDSERSSSGPRGPLHGIPILIKDNINTTDMETTAGSIALAGSFPPRDAFIVNKLRAAGAIIIGKTNLTEFANFMSQRMPNGYSSLGGQVLMPYNLNLDPSGSSSGSAVAAAANFATITIGTETSGSIISPAGTNSVVGLKPTVGLWSRTGIIPISATQDTAGPITRTVTDAAILLGALTGVDSQDAATENSQAFNDYTQFLDANSLAGASICVVRQGTSFVGSPEAQALMENALNIMRSRGANLIDPVSVPSSGPVPSLFDREFKTGINDYLAALGPQAPVNSLADIIEFNTRNSDRIRFGQSLLEASEATLGVSDPNYIGDREQILRVNRDLIDTTLTANNCSALLFSNIEGVITSASAGYPSITVPVGYQSNNLPWGLMFVSRRWEEGTIIRYAYAFEQASLARRTPEEINPEAYQ